LQFQAYTIHIYYPDFLHMFFCASNVTCVIVLFLITFVIFIFSSHFNLWSQIDGNIFPSRFTHFSLRFIAILRHFRYFTTIRLNNKSFVLFLSSFVIGSNLFCICRCLRFRSTNSTYECSTQDWGLKFYFVTGWLPRKEKNSAERDRVVQSERIRAKSGWSYNKLFLLVFWMRIIICFDFILFILPLHLFLFAFWQMNFEEFF